MQSPRDEPVSLAMSLDFDLRSDSLKTHNMGAVYRQDAVGSGQRRRAVRDHKHSGRRELSRESLLDQRIRGCVNLSRQPHHSQNLNSQEHKLCGTCGLRMKARTDAVASSTQTILALCSSARPRHSNWR